MRRNAVCLSLFVVILTSLVTGCPKKTVMDRPALVVVLFDPAAGQDTKQVQARAFENVVNCLKSGDVLLGGAISEQTEQTFEFEIEASMPTFDAMKESPMEFDGKVAALRDKQKEKAQKLLKVKLDNSDITGGLMEVAKAFNGSKYYQYKRKVLIVFTDGIEQNRRHDFASEGELAGVNVSKIIDQEKQLGRLPSLTGVTVYFTGISSQPDPRANMTEQKMSDVRRFWKAYCKEAGANLDPNNYGRSLVNFALH